MGTNNSKAIVRWRHAPVQASNFWIVLPSLLYSYDILVLAVDALKW